MSLNDSINLMMNPHRSFKAYMFHKDRRVTRHIVFPKGGKFKLHGNGYIINPNRIFFEKKTPCSVYSVSIAEPINPLDIDEKSQLSSQDFYNAIEATVVQDIIRSTGKVDNTLLMAVILMGGICILAVFYSIVHIEGLIQAQNAIIATLKAGSSVGPNIIGPG